MPCGGLGSSRSGVDGLGLTGLQAVAVCHAPGPLPLPVRTALQCQALSIVSICKETFFFFLIEV